VALTSWATAEPMSAFGRTADMPSKRVGFRCDAQADAGLLMSYGEDFKVQFRRIAVYVDKILKGAKPADLPVELPALYEFVINTNTARMLGLNIPASVLALTDRVTG
jgi:putative ABC transport system substrate-binding protein